MDYLKALVEYLNSWKPVDPLDPLQNLCAEWLYASETTGALAPARIWSARFPLRLWP